MIASARRCLELVRTLLGPIALLFLAIAAWQSRDLAIDLLAQAEMIAIAVAILSWAGLHLLSPLLATMLLRDLGADVTYRMALDIHVRRLPTRYVPGGIWHTVSRVIDLNGHGVDRPRLATLLIVENTFPFALAAVLGGTTWLTSGGRVAIGVAALVAGLLVLILAPYALLSKYLGTRVATPSLGVLARVALLQAVFWCVASSVFWLYWTALPNPGSQSALLVGSAYLVSWAVGFVAVFAPQGLGVFEASIAGLLGSALPFVGVAVLAAGFRLVVLCADAIAWCSRHALLAMRQPLPKTN
jgi:hypothetical protein